MLMSSETNAGLNNSHLLLVVDNDTGYILPKSQSFQLQNGLVGFQRSACLAQHMNCLSHQSKGDLLCTKMQIQCTKQLKQEQKRSKTNLSGDLHH